MNLKNLYVLQSLLIVLLCVNRVMNVVKLDFQVELLFFVVFVLTIISKSVQNQETFVFIPQNMVSSYFDTDYSKGLLCPDDHNNIGWNNLMYDNETNTFVPAVKRSGCDRENDFEHIGASTDAKSCYKSNVVNESLYDEFDVNYPNSSHTSKYLGLGEAERKNAPSVNCTGEGPRSMFMLSHNKYSPKCCGDSPYSTSGGCVCLTKEQKQCLSHRK
jgi:hypothetical protein